MNFGNFNYDMFKLDVEVPYLIPQNAKGVGIFGCAVSCSLDILALVGDVLYRKISPTKYLIPTLENSLRSLIASSRSCSVWMSSTTGMIVVTNSMELW